MTTYHKKIDGIIRRGDDGQVRFLSFWEEILYRMGFRP